MQQIFAESRDQRGGATLCSPLWLVVRLCCDALSCGTLPSARRPGTKPPLSPLSSSSFPHFLPTFTRSPHFPRLVSFVGASASAGLLLLPSTAIRPYDIHVPVRSEGGFHVPEAKTRVDWWDADTLLLATDWGEGSLTHSGYPRTVRLWRRGTPLGSALIVFEGLVTDVLAKPSVYHRPEGCLVRSGGR